MVSRGTRLTGVFAMDGVATVRVLYARLARCEASMLLAARTDSAGACATQVSSVG